jgi:hypothetical protein
MSKANDKAMDMFQKAALTSDFKEAFEVKEASKSRNFREEFIVAPLTSEEDTEIQLILFGESAANTATDEQVSHAHKALVDITTQIRAIERQNVLLHGERIRKAQEILKPYKDGAFTKWLVVAYGNRQTPYRILQYYEFFQSLSGEVRQLMQAMPKKAAYALAARNGDQEKKIEIIKGHHADKPENIIKLVQETFPLDSGDRRKRKDDDTASLDIIYSVLKKLRKRNGNLSPLTLSRIEGLIPLIKEIV